MSCSRTTGDDEAGGRSGNAERIEAGAMWKGPLMRHVAAHRVGRTATPSASQRRSANQSKRMCRGNVAPCMQGMR
jgi:hypothetical protein